MPLQAIEINQTRKVMLTVLEAIEQRHSVRRYKDIPLSEECRELMHNKIEEVNTVSGLHFQLVCDERKAFSGGLAYGKFFGVNSYIVAAGRKAPELDEQIGYYGEQLVLYAQQIGLNTCWAGLSYSKVKGTYELEDGEKIACYIALGYSETPGIQHKSKALTEISNLDAQSPEWFRKGVEAAALAPTAVNQQKFFIEYQGPKEGESLPRVKFDKGHSVIGYTKMDKGIARYHFELGASGGNITELPFRYSNI